MKENDILKQRLIEYRNSEMHNVYILIFIA